MKNLIIRKTLIPLVLTTSLILITTGCQSKNNETEIIVNENENIETEGFDNFEQEKEQIKNLINQQDFETAKEKGKEFFIRAVDFIFYNSEENGITFDELKEEAKKETFDNVATIDSWIMEFAPNYKDNTKEKYKIVKDFLSEQYYKSLNKIKNYLGSENYEALGNIKDQIKNDIKESSHNIKEKAKNWYKDFKSN